MRVTSADFLRSTCKDYLLAIENLRGLPETLDVHSIAHLREVENEIFG